jgi:ABC-type transport system involved in multi-copper enzyme maturation permease subunit
MTAQLSQAFLWVHPTVLTLVWAHETMYCTRLPAGEIDRGTADFLLCLPVSRWTVFVSESIGWLVSGAVILSFGLAGHLLAVQLAPAAIPMPVRSVVLVLVNFSCVYLAVGAFAFLISALSDRRGRAIGVIFALLLASFLLNFLAQFADWASVIAPYVSVMAYYRPAIILQSGRLPIGDLLVLLTLAAALWTAAGSIFHRRRICTV